MRRKAQAKVQSNYELLLPSTHAVRDTLIRRNPKMLAMVARDLGKSRASVTEVFQRRKRSAEIARAIVLELMRREERHITIAEAAQALLAPGGATR